MKKKKGYAFVLVLCVTTLMSALLLGVMTLSLSAKKSTSTLERTYKLSSMAESGVEKGLLCLKQTIETNPSALDPSSNLSSDAFSFTDNGVSCNVSFQDISNYNSTPDSAIMIDSVAKDLKTKVIKEQIAYVKKTDISNVYYNMMFSNAITVLDNVQDSSNNPNNSVSFYIGDSYSFNHNIANHNTYDITLDGRMYLQGGVIDFKPDSTPSSNGNDYYTNKYPGNVYYNYTDSTGSIVPKQFPNPDIYSSTYASGQVYVNCNKLLMPSDTNAATNSIFNNVTTFAHTLTALSAADQSRVGSLPSNQYPILNVLGPQSGETLYDYYKTASYSTKYKQYGYDISFVKPQSNQKLAAFLITKDPSESTTDPFYWGDFMEKVKDYIEANVPPMNHMADGPLREAYYKGVYKIYLIDGDVDVDIPSDVLSYINQIIYCTGTCKVYPAYYNQYFELENCSIMAKKMYIFNVSNGSAQLDTGYITTIDSHGHTQYQSVYMINYPFVRAVSLHGVKPINGSSGSDGLSPYNQANRNFINGFLLKHLQNYASNFTFKVDKWIEK